jgi:hypothetical protein
MKRAAIILSIALLATACSYFVQTHPLPNSLQWLAVGIDYIHRPVTQFSGLISGERRYLSALIDYCLLFVLYVFILVGIDALLRRTVSKGGY